MKVAESESLGVWFVAGLVVVGTAHGLVIIHTVRTAHKA